MEFCIVVEQQCINAAYYVGANLIKLNLFFLLVAQLWRVEYLNFIILRNDHHSDPVRLFPQ